MENKFNLRLHKSWIENWKIDCSETELTFPTILFAFDQFYGK